MIFNIKQENLEENKPAILNIQEKIEREEIVCSLLTLHNMLIENHDKVLLFNLKTHYYNGYHTNVSSILKLDKDETSQNIKCNLDYKDFAKNLVLSRGKMNEDVCYSLNTAKNYWLEIIENGFKPADVVQYKKKYFDEIKNNKPISEKILTEHKATLQYHQDLIINLEYEQDIKILYHHLYKKLKNTKFNQIMIKFSRGFVKEENIIQELIFLTEDIKNKPVKVSLNHEMTFYMSNQLEQNSQYVNKDDNDLNKVLLLSNTVQDWENFSRFILKDNYEKYKILHFKNTLENSLKNKPITKTLKI